MLRVSAADDPFDSDRRGETVDGGLVGAQLRALQSAATALARLRTEDRLPAVAASAARDGLDADVLLISLLDEEGRHLRTAHVGGVDRRGRERLEAIRTDDSSVIAKVVRTGQPVYQRSSRYAFPRITSLRPGIEWVAVLPLPTSDRPLGVIVLGRPGHRAFATNDMAFLDVLAGLCAVSYTHLTLPTILRV